MDESIEKMMGKGAFVEVNEELEELKGEGR